MRITGRGETTGYSPPSMSCAILYQCAQLESVLPGSGCSTRVHLTPSRLDVWSVVEAYLNVGLTTNSQM